MTCFVWFVLYCEIREEKTLIQTNYFTYESILCSCVENILTTYTVLPTSDRHKAILLHFIQEMSYLKLMTKRRCYFTYA
jgi:hypothetical protein